MKTTDEIHDMIQSGRCDDYYLLAIMEHINNRLAYLEHRVDQVVDLALKQLDEKRTGKVKGL